MILLLIVIPKFVSENRSYSKIFELLNKLTQELQTVANRDNILSSTENAFIMLVNDEIPNLKSRLEYIFKDNDVTEYEKIEFYEELGELMKEAVRFAKEDETIESEEIVLIIKLKQELSTIIKELGQYSDD